MRDSTFNVNAAPPPYKILVKTIIFQQQITFGVSCTCILYMQIE